MGAYKKPVAIVNPNSAAGQTARQWPHIEKLLSLSLGGVEALFTKAMGDATGLALEAARGGADLIISVGGDGTNNEVVNGLLCDGAPKIPPPIALVPRGTGGDFRKTIGIPNVVEEAVKIIAEGKPKRVDAGRMRITNDDGVEVTRYFLNISSFGIGGLVDRNVNKTTKIFGGKVSFILGTVKAFFAYKNQKVKISFDDGPFEEMVINDVAMANGRFFGGGMMIAPEASLDDGLLDVVIIGDITTGEALSNSAKIYKGTHMPHPKIRHLRAKKVVAEPFDPAERVLLDVDGEAPGRLPATFEIMPGALTVIA
jgi:YegS/Rv2252/BmrU family lipid kinase